MTFATIVQNPTFKKAWLSAAVVLGMLSILSGVFLAVHGRLGSAAGIVGGTALVSIGLVGFRGLARRAVHHI